MFPRDPRGVEWLESSIWKNWSKLQKKFDRKESLSPPIFLHLGIFILTYFEEHFFNLLR